jgi:hypothetical protein
MHFALTLETSTRLAGIALGHVEGQYPDKLDCTLTGPLDIWPLGAARHFLWEL